MLRAYEAFLTNKETLKTQYVPFYLHEANFGECRKVGAQTSVPQWRGFFCQSLKPGLEALNKIRYLFKGFFHRFQSPDWRRRGKAEDSKEIFII
jgi:hypothetical protein